MKTTRLNGARLGVMASLLALVLANPAEARDDVKELQEITKLIAPGYVKLDNVPGKWTKDLTNSNHPDGSIPAPKPLIIVLHGNGINANLAIQSMGFDQSKFIVRGLNGFSKTEGPCELEGFFDTKPRQQCMDFTFVPGNDFTEQVGNALVGFINAAQSWKHVDPKRIYVFGESGGGFALLRNLCKLAGKVAAVGVSAALPRVKDTYEWTGEGDTKQCASGKDIPYIHIHGTKDTQVPYDKVLNRPELGDFLHPKVETVVWRMGMRNRTNSNSVLTLPNKVNGDSSTVTEKTMFRDGSPMVRLLKVEGGGHLLPTPLPRYPNLRAQMIAIQNGKFGFVNLDIVAAEEVAKFFMLHKLK